MLSAHTQPNYTEDQIRKAALWCDVMKEQLADIHATYNVKPLQCYTKNLTPSNSPKFFTLVTESGKFVETLFDRALANLSSPIEESATFDASGLLSFKTQSFGNIPGYLYPLPCSKPSCVVVCCACKKQVKIEKEQKSSIRRKCGHIVHQLCLMPSVQKMKLSKLYKSELVEICKSLHIDPKGKKDDLKAKVKNFIANQPPTNMDSTTTSCIGCDEKHPSPTLRKFCHACGDFINEEQQSRTKRLSCGHILHSKCVPEDNTCSICSSLVSEMIEEISVRAIKTFSKKPAPSSQSSENHDDSCEEDEAEEFADEIPVDQSSGNKEKDIQVSTYFGELATKEKKGKSKGDHCQR